jgi:hypothetical protein
MDCTWAMKEREESRMRHRTFGLRNWVTARCHGTYCDFQVFQRLRQEDHEFEASLGCIVRACLKRKKREGGRKGRKERGREEWRKERKEGRKSVLVEPHPRMYLSLANFITISWSKSPSPSSLTWTVYCKIYLASLPAFIHNYCLSSNLFTQHPGCSYLKWKSTHAPPLKILNLPQNKRS